MEKADSEKIKFDFLPLTISIETLGGVATPLVFRGTPLPAKRSNTFSTAIDNQPTVEISVLLGESPLANKNIKLGSCLLEEIPPAPKQQSKIVVTFKVDKFCNVEVEAVESKSGKKIEAKLKHTEFRLTSDLIQKLINEGKENYREDNARAIVAEAELKIRQDQENNTVTENTKKIERLIGEIGIAITDGDISNVVDKADKLKKLLETGKQTYPPYDFNDLFGSFFKSTQTKRQIPRKPNKTQVYPKTTKLEDTNVITKVSTPTTALIQSFLESIDPELELKRGGAWEAIDSNRPDGRVQASHSMREVLRLLLDKLAPSEKVKSVPWYEKPKGSAPVTRAMKIRYALSGTSDIQSESTFSLINDLAAAIESMYAKLSAESHTERKTTVTATRMYLAACEALIGLIAIERKG